MSPSAKTTVQASPEPYPCHLIREADYNPFAEAAQHQICEESEERQSRVSILYMLPPPAAPIAEPGGRPGLACREAA